MPAPGAELRAELSRRHADVEMGPSPATPTSRGNAGRYWIQGPHDRPFVGDGRTIRDDLAPLGIRVTRVKLKAVHVPGLPEAPALSRSITTSGCTRRPIGTPRSVRSARRTARTCRATRGTVDSVKERFLTTPPPRDHERLLTGIWSPT